MKFRIIKINSHPVPENVEWKIPYPYYPKLPPFYLCIASSSNHHHQKEMVGKVPLPPFFEIGERRVIYDHVLNENLF